MCNNPCFLCGDIDECKLYKERRKVMKKLRKKWKKEFKKRRKENALCEEQN